MNYSRGLNGLFPPETTPESTPETTPEPNADIPDWLLDLPTYTLSDDCEDIERLLAVARNGTLWLALFTQDSDTWLSLDTIEDDPYPPQLDGRGRYFGCAIPVEGAQVCYVLAERDEETVLVAVPVWVGDAYYAPQPVETDEPETPEQQTGDNPPTENTGDNQPQPTDTPQPTQVPDSDGDGIADNQDACPNEPGVDWNGGCPDGDDGDDL